MLLDNFPNFYFALFVLIETSFQRRCFVLQFMLLVNILASFNVFDNIMLVLS